MNFSKSIVLMSLAFFIAGVIQADALAGNTALATIDIVSGYVDVTTAGVGFGGTDLKTCNTSVPRTIALPWGYHAATVKKAYLLWQASADGSSNFWVTLEGQRLESTNISSGKVCSKQLRKSWGFYVDVLDIVQSKLESSSDAFVEFSTSFETTCAPRALSNGASLLVVVEKKGVIPYGVIQIQAGGFAYDIKYNKDRMEALFEIPKEGTQKGLRSSAATLDLYSFIAESENFPGESEGFYLNGHQVPVQLNGNSGYDWENLKMNIDQWVNASATQLNVTLFSSIDCHIFIGMALQYEINDPSGNSSNIVEDPHAQTWDGAWVTLEEEGDFLLVESRSTGLAVHGRFCKSARGPWAPWTCAVAVRCAAQSGFVEIAAAKFNKPLYTSLDAPSVRYNALTKTALINCVDAGLSLELRYERFHRHPYVNVVLRRHPTAGPADLRGLLGSPTNDANDDFEYRDGRVWVPEGNERRRHYIGHSLPELRDIQLSWAVLEHERMFATQFVPVQVATVAPSRASSRRKDITAQAEAACRNTGVKGERFMAMCVHDAVSTGSLAGIPNLARHFTKSMI